MSTYSKLLYHIVFSTKYRRKQIDAKIRERLYEYIGGTIRNREGSSIEIGGIEDHVHILTGLSTKVCVSDLVRDIKSNSTQWMNDTLNTGRQFQWQKGYGVFTVSYSQLNVVRNYIVNQAEHHRKKSFKEEFIELLKRHNITFDEKYLFEGEFAA
jgi:putative transposase